MRATVLLAVAALEEASKVAPNKSDIVLCAWRLRPGQFGLKGYELRAPCSNSVQAKLSGLLTEEQVYRDGDGWRLTETGRAALRRAKAKAK